MTKSRERSRNAPPDESHKPPSKTEGVFWLFAELANGAWIALAVGGLFASCGTALAVAAGGNHATIVVIAAATGAVGLALGCVLALKAKRRSGTTAFIAGHMATPELDVLANRTALSNNDPTQVANALRHLIELGLHARALRPKVEALTGHDDPKVRDLAERALRAIDGSSAPPSEQRADARSDRR